MSTGRSGTRKPLIVRPNQGRAYEMGRMRAVFFADGPETDSRYSISEWWLEPRTLGPGAHSHADDHIFYVLVGTVSFLVDGKRTETTRGTYVLIPGGVPHDFENHGEEKCGFISINVPAGFEQMMPSLVEWFGENPLRSVDDA
jgi:quercetin dioxygenase-like cupin family protein